MTPQETIREVAGLRFRLQMNNRLRLESLAALSKVFRDFGEPVQDELLSSIVLAVPEELLGEYSASPEHRWAKATQSRGGSKKKPPPPRPPLPPPRPPMPPPRPPLPPGRKKGTTDDPRPPAPSVPKKGSKKYKKR